LALVEPHYPKAGNGRQPVGLSIMLRTYFLQQWFSLSDSGTEEAFYESAVLRRFAGVDLGVTAAPDETTILRFRHLLEQHDLCGQMLMTVNRDLETKGIRIRPAPSWTRRLFTRPRRPRTPAASAIPRCIRLERASSSISAPKRTSAWTASRRWCIRLSPRQPAWPTNICCPTYCTATNARRVTPRTKPRSQGPGVGRCRLSGAARSDLQGRAACPGHDLAANAI